MRGFFSYLQVNSSICPACPEERMRGLFSPNAFYCHSPHFLEKKKSLTVGMHDGSVGSVKEGKAAAGHSKRHFPW